MPTILEKYNKYYKNENEYQEKIDKKILDKKRKDDNWPYPKDEEYKPNFKLTSNIKKEVKKITSNQSMTFSVKNRVLEATCNTEDKSKCSEEMSIPLPTVYQFDEIKKKLRNKIKFIKKEIIRWKLNLLYKLDNEDVVLREFEQLKEQLSFNQQKLKKIISIQKKKTIFTVDVNGEQENSNLNDIVEKYTKNINEEKYKFKNLIQDFKKDTTETSVLDAAMEKYMKIKDSIDQKREIEYKLGNIEVENHVKKMLRGEVEVTHILIKEKLSYNNLEIDDN